MPERPADEQLREYVAILRGIGLTERAILESHGDGDHASGSLTDVIAEELPGADAEHLHDGLLDAIAASARGIDAPAEYWNHAPEVHLDELLAPYGCSVTIEPTKFADTLAEGKFIVRLSDADGTEFWTRFEYPESDLGEDNYPALVDRVQRQLLGPAGLRLVRLVSPSRRWRFAMMSDAQLEALQNRYGDRITVFGAPLLAADQPPAFASEEPPIPEWYDTTEDSGAPSPDEELSIEVPRTESLDELEPTDAEIEFDDVGESAESIVESVEQADAGSGETAADAEVEASDNEVEAVFGDLSDVSLEPEEPEPEPDPAAGGETLAIDGGSTTATDADDPMDSLFEDMKRDIADTEPETGEHADAGNGANVADLVDSVEEGPPASEDSPDVPQDAADLTASELFSSLDEE